MEVKVFELRDRGTLVPAVAIRLIAANAAEEWLLHRAGFAPGDDLPFILLGNLDGGKFCYDQYNWGANGTKFTAHEYIRRHWGRLESGQVICTEYIRGERTQPKKSERFL